MSSKGASYGEPATRHRILQAAWDLVEDNDSGIRLADVAARAGVSRQAVYLHFGDRAGLLVALVEFVDETLGLEELVTHALDAPSGGEALQRMVNLHSIFTPKIDSITQVLEAAQYKDEAVAAAWRNRMHRRRAIYQSVVQRIANEGLLAEGWTIGAAADLCYAVTMPGLWRELTHEFAWSADDYAAHITRLLGRSILVNDEVSR